ncbi:hypothetical protein DFH07DRAFT_306853 [Mycena maculata]|uniref:ORC1/DEAH AAA+ ATPase domain-containing protein n=1 Tax=Mycena maculata TaxID=230809 RepID=A0AAD7NN57_9AGAR|nr:hypothetical protein DFH07DRAFT_306853 [Mycena maculata]
MRAPQGHWQCYKSALSPSDSQCRSADNGDGPGASPGLPFRWFLLTLLAIAQRVRDNKSACVRMTERAYELICAIINICRDSEAELSPAMVRSIDQFSDTLQKILSFVRSQVKGGIFRRMFRSMEDANLIQDCNVGLKHALDVFGVQAGLIAAMTMAEMQKDATTRHEELIVILKEKRSKPKRTSGDGSSSRRKRPSNLKTDLTHSLSTISMLPASPKIFYGREEEVKHVVNTMKHSKPARITICGADGVGKTAIALCATHHPDISEMFGVHRYFVECEGATDVKQLCAAIAMSLGLESLGRKSVTRHLTAIATEENPALLVLDALDRSWRPHETRNDVEDFVSLLADQQYVTIVVTIRGGERPRQVRWTRPFLPTLSPLPASAARSTFLDISDASPDDPAFDELLEITENNPATITHMAGIASFEGCAALVARWRAEGSALLVDKEERKPPARPILADGIIVEEPEEMFAAEVSDEELASRVRGPVPEKDISALLDMHAREPMPTIETLLSRQPTLEELTTCSRQSTLVESLISRQSTLAESPTPSRRSTYSKSATSSRSTLRSTSSTSSRSSTLESSTSSTSSRSMSTLVDAEVSSRQSTLVELKACSRQSTLEVTT